MPSSPTFWPRSLLRAGSRQHCPQTDAFRDICPAPAMNQALGDTTANTTEEVLGLRGLPV